MTSQRSLDQLPSALLGKMSAVECTDFLRLIVDRYAQVSNRLSAIRPAGKNGSMAGPARRDALLSGNMDAVSELDAEHERLAIENQQLQAQRDELSKRRQAAGVREAVDGMPSRYKGMEKALQAAESARDSLATALSEVDTVYQDITQARYKANAARADLPAAKPDLLQRIEALEPWAVYPLGLYTRLNFVAENLGIEKSRDWYAAPENREPASQSAHLKRTV